MYSVAKVSRHSTFPPRRIFSQKRCRGSERSSLIAKVKHMCLFPPSIRFMPTILIALAPQSASKQKLPCNDPILSWDPKPEPSKVEKCHCRREDSFRSEGHHTDPSRALEAHTLSQRWSQHREWSDPEHTVHEQDHSLESRTTSRAIRGGEAGERESQPQEAKPCHRERCDGETERPGPRGPQLSRVWGQRRQMRDCLWGVSSEGLCVCLW